MREDLGEALDENLRMATSMVADTLRNAGCGVPKDNLASWIDWTSGFTNGPVSVVDGGSSPDTLSVAVCTPPLATITNFAAAGATTLAVDPVFAGSSVTDVFNDADKSLVWIDYLQYATVRTAGEHSLAIDTDPVSSGDQGLATPKLPGTPITRVDVVTFRISNDTETGRPRLELDKHRGSPVSAADGITDLQVATLVPNRQYRVTLTGRSDRVDPATGVLMTRTSEIEITTRN
jgi:hypothetical protein